MSIASNAGLVTTELIISLFTGSLSVLADAFHSGVDLTGSLVAFAGILTALNAADREYAYGYGRYENAAALVQFVLIAVIGVTIIVEAVRRYLFGFSVDISPLSIVAILATFGFDLLVFRYISRRSRALKSPALEADSYHFGTDAVGKVGVLFGISLAYLGYPMMDLVGAVLIAVSFLVIAFLIGRRNVRVLADASPDPAVMEALRACALRVPGVHEVHSLRGRTSGATILVDLVVHLDPRTPLEEAHRIAHRVEDEVRAAIPGVSEVFVHAEPAHHERRLDDSHSV